ncbi:MAG TPA: aldo/keto reductase [Rubrivivax sp.]|nr:aldo/keto reductase [Rubrivivax sp.]
MDARTARSPASPEVTFPSGEERPALGMGTWRMGEDASQRGAEVRALRLAMEIGYRVIDTAEMYGDGGAESVLGQALAEALREGVPRDDLFVVSKVLPQNASESGVLAACEASLRRLRLDCIDLYLLHWRGGVPLAETVRGFETLQRRGWIRQWGVSNFDLDELRDLVTVPGGTGCAANQVYYSLSERGVEFDLLPWQQLHQMPLMAYSPIDQGELVDHPGLRTVAESHRATPAQVALAWVLRQPGVMALPKALRAVHLRHNWSARELRLGDADLAQIDRLFPPPRRKRPLAVR